jgi:chain length determinant protein EpsF
VVDALKFADSDTAKKQFMEATKGKGDIRDWFADLLLQKLDVVPSRESSVIEISFSGSDPDFAAGVANTFAAAYQQTSLQLKAEPAQGAATYLSSQSKTLREELEKAQARLSKYQQDNGITSGIEQFDTENARLNELTTQYVVAQSQAIEASSRKAGVSSNAADSPDVASNALVQGLKVDIARSESKLADLSQRLDKNHPQIQSAQAEISKLRSQLQEAIRSTSASVGGSAKIYRQRESELAAQVAAQKQKVLKLNRTRDQLMILQRDMENAQRSLDAVSQRFMMSNLEGQANQTDISILNPAVAPIEHSSPKILLNILLSVFLGLMLGVGFGLLAEMLDRRVRSVEDIQESVEIPVLGVLSSVISTKSKRFSFLRFLKLA